MIKANPERVLRDLQHLRSIGTFRTGVHRPTLSPEDMTARQWLVAELEAIGHAAHIDGIASVFGISPATGKVVLGGSHLESQNESGWLDGALGVVYALEAARAVAEAGDTRLGVDVVAFSDEEGHFGSFMGSRSALGQLDDAAIDAAVCRTRGESMRSLLAAAGLADTPRTTLDVARYAGFFEAHIEQGGSLIADGNRIGVVTGIVGARTSRIKVDGAQNHAGTTRMVERRDAGVALRQVAALLEARASDLAGPRTVWTIGEMVLEPGAPSIVPGHAEMYWQFRDTDPAILAAFEKMLADTIAEADAASPCTITVEMGGMTSKPAAMDPALMAALDAAAEAHAPGKHVRMPSAMLFVPSIGGISHHWSEDTEEADIALGAEVYVDAVARVLTG
jgi:N-carbamoyl-L-amino-acid hydrolase